MKKICPIIVLTTFLILAACGGSKLSLQKVSLTEPWTSINLPCNGEAVVIVANEYQFNCAYGGE